MPKRILPLAETKVRGSKPKEKDYKLYDGGGLYLLVTKTGGRLWRLKYSFDKKSRLLALGAYPETSLEEAREKRLEARKLLAKGIDPSKEKRAARRKTGDDSFRSVALSWHAKMVKDQAWSTEHAGTIKTRLEKDVFPWLGDSPIREVTAGDIREILDRVRGRGVIETARRVRTICSQVFVYAISVDKASYDLAASLKSHLPPTGRTRQHMAAITDPKALGPVLRMLDGYQGELTTQGALRLLPLFFVRPGNLRHMEWAEIDFEESLWSIPKEKMKMKQAHVVPLARQAVAVLKTLKPLTGGGKYVFPSVRSKARPMSDNTINGAFRRMGIDSETLTGHGFRATARTILDEILGYRIDIIEHQLAHRVKDPNGRAYNRTAHLDYRRGMMQAWADYLDGLKATRGNL